jgi:hypothetical protein
MAKINAVSAGLFITRPCFSTVCGSARHSALVTWVDDGFEPHLGAAAIDTYTGNKNVSSVLRALIHNCNERR